MPWSGRRNPYVILGIRFGASRDEASDAFALRARGLRHAPDGTERLNELTWALNQVDEILKEPELALEVYRVPADPGALEPDEPGVLRPPPEMMSRTTTSSEAELGELMDAARREAVAALQAEIASNSRLPLR